MKPLHKHDCERCMFLGSINGMDGYYCPTGETYILRFSSEGSDYTSRGDRRKWRYPELDVRILRMVLVALMFTEISGTIGKQ